MLLELSDKLTLRQVRLEVAYTAARLNALAETRHLADDFTVATEQLELLEAEEARLELQQIETQAMVEIADDAWDDVMESFQRRLLELSGYDQDHDLYRTYFAELPTEVTNLSYAAEIMISKDLEQELQAESREELRAFADRLASRRGPLEAALNERTRLEVEIAKFHNRAALARALVNRLRRMLLANVEELASARDRDSGWTARFFRGVNAHLDSMDRDGAEESNGAPAPQLTETVALLAPS